APWLPPTWPRHHLRHYECLGNAPWNGTHQNYTAWATLPKAPTSKIGWATFALLLVDTYPCARHKPPIVQKATWLHLPLALIVFCKFSVNNTANHEHDLRTA